MWQFEKFACVRVFFAWKSPDIGVHRPSSRPASCAHIWSASYVDSSDLFMLRVLHARRMPPTIYHNVHHTSLFASQHRARLRSLCSSHNPHQADADAHVPVPLHSTPVPTLTPLRAFILVRPLSHQHCDCGVNLPTWNTSSRALSTRMRSHARANPCSIVA